MFSRPYLLTSFLLLAGLLMGLGDLRRLITPLGYWLAWAIWMTSVLLTVGPPFWHTSIKKIPKPVIIAFFTLIAGMALTSILLPDTQSLYQACKIGAIAVMFVAMYALMGQIDGKQVALIIKIVIVIILLLFFTSKLASGLWYIRLGDGREGMLLSYPGVIWKVGCLLLPVVWADLAGRRGTGALGNGIVTGMALFLLLQDGSRTGFILSFIMAASLILSMYWKSDIKHAFLQRSWWLSLIITLAFSTVINKWIDTELYQEKQEITISSTSPEAGTSWFQINIEPTEAPLAIKRMAGGDSNRLHMLREGLAMALQCQPLGCGFGATAVELPNGDVMVVHNAYLTALGDFGIVGALGMLALVLATLLPLRQVLFSHDLSAANRYYAIAAVTSGLAFCASLLLNTFTTEMSEWGYFILMLAWAWALVQRSKN